MIVEGAVQARRKRESWTVPDIATTHSQRRWISVSKGDMLAEALMSSARLRQHLMVPSIRSRDAESAALTAAERKTVTEHLEQVLLSPVFRNTKRYSGLLRYVVEETLNGASDLLKERTIGIEVFGRAPDYDTTTDHSVRSAAGEVRKRLAQYYMESDADSSLRIELQAGSYVPQFRFPVAKVAKLVEVTQATEKAQFSVDALVPDRGPRPGLLPMGLAAFMAIVVLVALGFTLRSAWSRPTPFQQLWNPIFSSQGPALLCIGGGSDSSIPVSTTPLSIHDFEHTAARRMNIGDAMTLAGLTGVLQANGKQYRILNRASATSFRDLQQGPFVLIGALNNEWTLRLTKGLRFTFNRQADAVYVADRQNPANTAWSFNFSLPYTQLSRDYGIVSRIRDPRTEQIAMIVAGIGSWGTQAAGEFVTNPVHLKKLDAIAPRNWEQKNLQVVIATDVIGGSSGPPIVVAAYFW